MSAEPSGVTSRQALVAARGAAKKNGATQTKKPKRRTGTAVRRDGPEPLWLGAAIGMMMTERGIVAPDASVYNTKLRLITPKLIAVANERVQAANLRTLPVLAPAPAKASPATAASNLAPQAAPPAAPVQRAEPPDGCCRAIEANR